MLNACLFTLGIGWLDAEATRALLDAFLVASWLVGLDDSALLLEVDNGGRLGRWTNSARIVTRLTFPYFTAFFPMVMHDRMVCNGVVRGSKGGDCKKEFHINHIRRRLTQKITFTHQQCTCPMLHDYVIPV